MIVGEVSALTFPVISFCELLPSKLEMMKMAALLTDAFNLIMWWGFFFFGKMIGYFQQEHYAQLASRGKDSS